MGWDLPEIGRCEFDLRLRTLAPEALTGDVLDRLWAHYQELRRWNRIASLIGPGTREEILERHYGEALAALPVLPDELQAGLDLGSGAGFPGWVVAAARPAALFTLVEPRQRKWAFLEAACRRAALSCVCLDVRVGWPLPAELPAQVDVVTVRALRLDARTLAGIAGRLRPGGRLLLWTGEGAPVLPAGWGEIAERTLPPGRRRRIVVAADLRARPSAGS